jgi:uncharacterized membrane protein
VPVDSFEPNPWGLYQVHGNTSEWTEDCFGGGYRDAPSDGSAQTWLSYTRPAILPKVCSSTTRAVRGGSWIDHQSDLRAASRASAFIDQRYAYVGFRVARILIPLDEIEEEAKTFIAALGSEEAISSYIDSCKRCEFVPEARVELALIKRTKTLGRIEEEEFRLARGSVAALKKYVAGCQVCAFAQTAAQQIQQSSNYQNSLFKFKVCNNDRFSISVSGAGQEDPVSNMWIIKGWFVIKPKECGSIFTFAKETLYAMARNERATWSGNSRNSFCVDLQRRFYKNSLQ